MTRDNAPHEGRSRARCDWRVPVLALLCLSLTAALLLRSGRGPVVSPTGETPVQAGNRDAGDRRHDHGSNACPGHDRNDAEGTDASGRSAATGNHDAHDHEAVATFTPAALAKAGIEVRTVAPGEIPGELPVTGVVEPDLARVVKVTPRVGGKLTALLANVGDRVRAGQVLARMASAELAASQAQYRQATARASAARANLKRQRQLAGFGEFGQHKVQEARGAFNAAREDVNEALAEVNASRNEVAQAEAALAAARSDEASARSDVTAAETAIAQAETQVEVTRSRFARQDALLKEELTSRQDWEQARADALKAEADVRAARAGLQAARARGESAAAKVRQAQAMIETQRARLSQSEAKRLAAHERFTLAAEAMQREERVYRSGIFATREVADAEAALRQAEFEVAAAADAVRLRGGTPGGGHVLALTSPLAGRVMERTVTIGETAPPEKPLFTVVNLDSVWVQLNVYPRDLPAVRVGLPVSIATDAAPGRVLVGRVAYVGDTLDETTRTARVRCVIANPDGLLKPEMFVRGGIRAASRAPVIVVPRDAVQSLEGRRVVFVPGERPGAFRALEVQAGETRDGQTEIVSGLRPGDRVVIHGAFLVKAQAMKGELGHSHGH
jgi:cobalt-zinc-cadmium efflux system membrane fusion protein